MAARTFIKALYALTGTLLVIAGIATTLYTSSFLPAFAKNVIANVARHDLNGIHLVQELGAVLFFAGLVCFWMLPNYGKSIFFHWAITSFFIILAYIHWNDARGPWRSVMGPVINSVPAALYIITGAIRLALKQ